MKKKILFVLLLAVVISAVFILYPREEQVKQEERKDGDEITVTAVMTEEEPTSENSEGVEDETSAISQSRAEEIASDYLEGYMIIGSERRSSTGEKYYLVQMENGDEKARIYIDADTGEILYQD